MRSAENSESLSSKTGLASGLQRAKEFVIGYGCVLRGQTYFEAFFLLQLTFSQTVLIAIIK